MRNPRRLFKKTKEKNMLTDTKRSKKNKIIGEKEKKTISILFVGLTKNTIPTRAKNRITEI